MTCLASSATTAIACFLLVDPAPRPRAHRPHDVRPDRRSHDPAALLGDQTAAPAQPLDSRHVTQAFQAVLARAGIRRQRFHDLRHAFATLQLEAGAELFDVSRALGHADIGTTANVYAHFTEAMADRMADRMAGILGAASEGR